VARILQRVVDKARARGIRAGLLRPITLFPFPSAVLRQLARRVRSIVTVELSTGQMLEDVRLAVEGLCPVKFFSRVGGNVPSSDELLDQLVALPERELCHA
jgi:pyruvate/2-oxoacid:ferredoxin oxidoreductase alpha subunit